MSDKLPEPLALRSQVDSMLYSTVRIEADLPGGMQSVGTGFFIRYTHGEDYFSALVTNKHVVRGAVGGRIYMHQAVVAADGPRQPSGLISMLEIVDFPKIWINHPVHSEDSDEDLRAFEVMEDVAMVGYPNGLWDNVHGFPLFRRGTTATHPYVDFKGWPVGALDIGAYWGSSGPPVILLRRGVDYSISRRPANIPVLLGILYVGPVLEVEGKVHISGVPTEQLPLTSTTVPMHLGYYVKARELFTLRDEMYHRLNIKSAPLDMGCSRFQGDLGEDRQQGD